MKNYDLINLLKLMPLDSEILVNICPFKDYGRQNDSIKDEDIPAEFCQLLSVDDIWIRTKHQIVMQANLKNYQLNRGIIDKLDDFDGEFQPITETEYFSNYMEKNVP
jgi:hypothetical protein